MLRVLLGFLLILQSGSAWALKPNKEWIATPDSLKLRYQTLTLATPDKVKLISWVIEPIAGAPDQHTTMVLAYGDAGNMSYWLHQAQALAQAGYRVYLFDYRGFGHSADFAIDPARLYYPEFVTDLGTALTDAQRRYPRDKTGVLAFSMGTIMGSLLAAKARPDFFISEGYVASPQRLVVDQLQRRQKIVNLPTEASAYPQVAAHIRCPWLLIAGTLDVNTPLADSAAIVRAAARRRQLLTFEGGHLEGMSKLTKADFGDKYVREISRFLAAKRR